MFLILKNPQFFLLKKGSSATVINLKVRNFTKKSY